MKWLFPLFLFGFLVFFVAEPFTCEESDTDLLSIIVPMPMAVFLFFFFKTLVWDLADAVYDHGA